MKLTAAVIAVAFAVAYAGRVLCNIVILPAKDVNTFERQGHDGFVGDFGWARLAGRAQTGVGWRPAI
jgi:hypothetical protein